MIKILKNNLKFMQKYTKIVFWLLLASAFLPAVALASGLSSAQIQSIINLLQSFGADSATVSNVQISLNGGTPTPSQSGSMPVQSGIYPGIPAGFSFSRNLSIGSAGWDVSYLKIILASENCFSVSTSNTGFGPLTQAGVMCLQNKYGISPTGVLDSATIAKLNSLLSSTPGKSCSTDADCPQIATTNTMFPADRCINGRCVLQQSNCTPNWTCGWGPCTNGYQSESAVDSNNCGLSSSGANIIACPALARVCNTSNSITINSVSGPNSLNIGQTGNWQVNATAPSGTTLTYSVDWGDTVYYPMLMANGAANTSQTSSFTHSYSQAGTYTVKFTVSSPSVCPTGGMMYPCTAGNSATTSITVQVLNSISQPSGIILFYGQGCPHCANVDNYIAANNIAQKVNFQELETFYNATNASLMNSKAAICGLAPGSIGVPFLWDGSRCYLGDTDIINFFSKYVSAQPLITVTSPSGAETLKVGQAYYILWNSSGLNVSDDVYISLQTMTVCPAMMAGCQNSFTINSSSVKNTGNYLWDTNTKMGGASTGPNSMPVVAGSNYRIKVCDGNTCGYSNYFNIAQ